MPHPEVPSTESLLGRCASAPADERSWRLLVERLGPPVRGAVAGALLAGRGAVDPDQVDDLVQEVWCRLLERDRRALRGCRGDGHAAVVRYVKRIALAVAVDALRSDGAGKRAPRRLQSIEDPRCESRAAIDRRACPERRLLARERVGRFFGLCRELVDGAARGERLRIVRLAWLEGWSSREIAAELGGWSPSAVDCLLHRLRTRLAARGERAPRRLREAGFDRV